MFTVLLVIQILISISIITLVLLQQGKGADMGAGFGAGASGTVFGARGAASFFTRATAILATVFFANCLLIASPLVLHVSRSAPDSVIEHIQQQEAQQQATKQESAAAALDKLNEKASELPEIAPSTSAGPAPAAEPPAVEAPAAASPPAPETAAPQEQQPDDLPE